MRGEVLKLGEEAEGLVCRVAPVLLRVGVEHVLIDKEVGVGCLTIERGRLPATGARASLRREALPAE